MVNLLQVSHSACVLPPPPPVLLHPHSWEPLQQKEGGSLLGEGKFHFESPSKSTKISSLAKESKSSGSPGTSDSPKRQKINTKTAEDRPGNYPCGFCGM